MNLNYPQSFVEVDYKKQVCDLWDHTGFYFESTVKTTTANSQSIISTTSRVHSATRISTTISTSTTCDIDEETENTIDAATLRVARVLRCAHLSMIASYAAT